MSRKANISLAFFLLLALLAVVPSAVKAGDDSPPEPGRIEPPPITGVNTGGTLSEGDTGSFTPSGTLTGLEVNVPLASGSPRYVDLALQPLEDSSVHVPSLGVPLRYQDPADATCGAAALGMALEFASHSSGKPAPTTGELIAGLRHSGLLYETGTGVEELAYLARNRGYRGSYPFHGWTLEQLQAHLREGRPVVVALGANGSGKPGHFVTVTGISGDGRWVRYHDPTLGVRTVPAADFLRLWRLQGSSGMVVRTRPLSAASDPMLAWMGLFGTLSMLAVLARQEEMRDEWKTAYRRARRKLSNPLRMGLGGMLSGGASGGKSPAYGLQKVQVGWKRVPKKVPVYETRKVKVGTKTVTSRVPNFTLKRVQVGTRTETYKVKVTRYRTVKYTDHVKDTYRVPVYRTRKYVKRYHYQRVRKTKWARRGWRFYRKTYYTWKRKPVYGRRRVRVGWRTKTRWKKITRTKRMPYTAYETRTRQVPVYDMRRVRDGWKAVTRDVPQYKEKKVQVDTRIVYDRVPEHEWHKMHTGWHEAPDQDPDPPHKSNHPKTTAEYLKSLDKAKEEPQPKTTAEYFNLLDEHYDGTLAGSDDEYDYEMKLFRNRQAAYQTQQIPIPTGEQIATSKPKTSFEGKWFTKGVKLAKKAKDFFTARAVAFNTLESGHISVSAPSRAVGTRRAFLNKYGYKGTRYKPSTITGITSRQLIKGSLSKSTWITAAVTSLAGNVIDYRFGKNKDKGIASQEFAVSTAVDTVMAVGTGLAAAATVALIGAGIAAATPFALSAAAGIALTAAAGVGIGYLLDRFGVNKKAKEIVNTGVDIAEVKVSKHKDDVKNGIKAWGGVIKNAKIIGQYGKEKAKVAIRNKASTTGQKIQDSVYNLKQNIGNSTNSIKNTVEDVKESINDTLSDAADTIERFFSGVFGG